MASLKFEPEIHEYATHLKLVTGRCLGRYFITCTGCDERRTPCDTTLTFNGKMPVYNHKEIISKLLLLTSVTISSWSHKSQDSYFITDFVFRQPFYFIVYIIDLVWRYNESLCLCLKYFLCHSFPVLFYTRYIMTSQWTVKRNNVLALFDVNLLTM